jgi:hypothetical protein
MLNLAAMIGEFGSPRNVWDGLDEKAIQRVKSMLSNLNLASDTWLATILNHVTREQTLNTLAANMYENPHQAQQNFHSIIGNIRVFGSKDIVTETYNSGLVMSAVVLKDGVREMMVVYKTNEKQIPRSVQDAYILIRQVVGVSRACGSLVYTGRMKRWTLCSHSGLSMSWRVPHALALW